MSVKTGKSWRLLVCFALVATAVAGALILQGTNAYTGATLIGTNTGPGGTGNRVRVSGFESWRFGPDGLIVESQGHFDSADYMRQLAGESSST